MGLNRILPWIFFLYHYRNKLTWMPRKDWSLSSGYMRRQERILSRNQHNMQSKQAKVRRRLHFSQAILYGCIYARIVFPNSARDLLPFVGEAESRTTPQEGEANEDIPSIHSSPNETTLDIAGPITRSRTKQLEKDIHSEEWWTA
ncbi:hypothetical protein PVAP13_4NG144671 [Panicum virgatum]|uniref:Uncharacterized protein n=1 Tax=Panicum virgatum TaxID=38727 RepID=A0A8T0TDI0_PANVG|nr:hypothetical protein PVAP13_4NG144671 [Panicum virgatum]